MAKKCKAFKSLRDLRERCEAGETAAQEAAVNAVENLGVTHLESGGGEHWRQCLSALQAYLASLEGEYGQDYDDAEKTLVGEVNFVR